MMHKEPFSGQHVPSAQLAVLDETPPSAETLTGANAAALATKRSATRRIDVRMFIRNLGVSCERTVKE